MSSVCIQKAVTWAALALCQAFVFSIDGHAQGFQASGYSEWSSFVSPAVEPVRTGPLLDLAFQDLKQEGPWSHSAEIRLSQAERRQFELLDGVQWLDALKQLKQDRPDLNRRDEQGRTPLSIAARAGELELVKEMLRQGADPDMVGAGGLTALGGASFAGHELVVRELLRKDARVDVPMSRGQYPLHLACASGQLNIIRLLLASGADWRLPNGQGRHAVEEAAYFGQQQALALLQERGADLAARDQYRLNAVHAAAIGEQPQTVAWLRARGVAVPSIFSQLLIDQLVEGGARTP